MTGNCDIWEIWFANVKYEDSNIIEERPILIILIKGDKIIAAKGTKSDPRDGCFGEYSLRYWKEAGLSRNTTIRCTKIVELLRSDLVSYAGKLHPVDIYNIEKYI